MPLPKWHPPFPSVSGVWWAKPLFSVVECKFVIFDGPFLEGNKNTVYQKHGCTTQILELLNFQVHSQTFFELRFSLEHGWEEGKTLRSQTWPGNPHPRRPSSRHPRPAEHRLPARKVGASGQDCLRQAWNLKEHVQVKNSPQRLLPALLQMLVGEFLYIFGGQSFKNIWR